MLKLLQKEEKNSQGKIRVGFYPYTYVRAVVMRTLLFKSEDYNKMLKMSFGEIAKFLQDSNYKNEINTLAADYSGADLLEKSLNKNLSESFKKLIRISSFELGLLIKEYLLRKDMEDIKTIIRGKFTNAGEKTISDSITASGTLSRDFLVSLIKMESIEETLKNNGIAEYSLLKAGLKHLQEKGSLLELENSLDKYYYSRLIEFSRRLPRQGLLFKNFLLKEIEVQNILTLLRLKKANFDDAAIRNFIILSQDKKKDSRIIRLSGSKNLDELLDMLGKSEYAGIITNGMQDYKSKGTLITFENELHKHMLRQSILLSHQYPLSIDTILGYMFAKDIEVRNIRIIVKGKQLGLSEEFIGGQMVY